MRSAIRKLAKLAPYQEFQEIKEPNWNKSPTPRKPIEVTDASDDEDVMIVALVQSVASPPPSPSPGNYAPLKWGGEIT